MGTDSRHKHPVLFVGAGPGDPELITVKGQRALGRADVVLYTGSLVPQALLQWAPSHARRINSARMDLEAIVAAMEEHWRRGRRVVRLHTGDPSLYGALFEQMAALDRRKIAYRIIPGVTAAFAAAATLGIEYTLPEVTQTLILTRMAGRTPVPAQESLDLLAAHRASMVIYLSTTLVSRVAEALKGAYGEKAPCAVVYRASQPEEKVLAATLETLPETVEEARLSGHAVIVVSPVLGVASGTPALRSKLYDRSFKHGCR